jgi:hypothetical protein
MTSRVVWTAAAVLLAAALFPSAAPAAGRGLRVGHPISASAGDATLGPRAVTADTVRLLAVMVQFQRDTDARTSGDGRFVLTAPTDSLVDAPPRDARYFRDHLRFLERYYERVSRGKLVVRSTLVDSVVTLAGVMATYSPGRNASNKPVADLARDTWRAVDSLGLVPDFTPYETFVVFHAGVGRDIDLVGLLGYDPTPLDIPSLYIGPQALEEFYGTGFEGFPVQGGAVYITNSIVLPETETRSIPGVGGDVTIELGINGLMCASLGNSLGLPDLFDTNTGRSGIGRFGLMDGQSIFSFSGVFPPEPSAWEKYWLGWISPVDVPAGASVLTLPAVSLSDSVYRIPIGASEYYLVENRNRDAGRDGQRIVSVYNGVERTQFFARDTAGFEAFDISALAGSVTDVEDFDWSLPGGVTEEGEFYDGGILIWQIDEEVIARTIGANAVNADPARRGVRVVEADGSQDIGQDYEFLQPGSGSQDGTSLDFWFSGNPAPVYANEFSTQTHPPALSNAGADPHLAMSAFSVRGPRMTVQVTRGSASFSPVPGFPKYFGAATTFAGLSYAENSVSPTPTPVLLVTTGVTPAGPVQNNPDPGLSIQASVRAYALDGSPALSSGGSSGVVTTVSGGAAYSGPAAASGGPLHIVTPVPRSPQVPGYILITEMASGAPGDTLGAVAARIDLDRTFVTPAIFADTLIAVADEADSLYVFSRVGVPGGSVLIPLLEGERVAGLCSKPWLDLTPARVVVTGDKGTLARVEMTPAGPEVQTVRRVGRPIVGPAATIFAARAGQGPAVQHGFVTSDGYVYLVDESFTDLPTFPVRVGDSISTPAAYADLNRDNSRDIIVFSGNRIHAVSRAGSSLDYFPVTLTGSSPLSSPPVVGDIAGTDTPAVLGVTLEGLVVAYDGQGRMVSGFPLLAGRGPHTAAIVSGSEDSTFVAVASAGDGSLSLWRTGGRSNGGGGFVEYWPQYQADAGQSGRATIDPSGAPVSAEYFPPSRAYNWPNPAYDGRTFIRYFVGEASTVSIKIFDQAGDLVKELAGPGVGGVDNEVEWDVRSIQSGVYFARIEAQGGGQHGSTTVKIAVVK